MKRFLFLLAFILALSGQVWGAPQVDTKGVFFVDPTASPVSKYERSGLTVYIPFQDKHDFHSGIRPRNGEGVIGYGSFTRASTATYIHPDTGYITTASSGELRYQRRDGRIGLLLEPAAVNHVFHSAGLNEAGSWSASQTTVEANATTSPDGTVNAEAIRDTAVVGGHSLAQGIDAYLADDTIITLSMFIKFAEGGLTQFQLQSRNRAGTYRGVKTTNLTATTCTGAAIGGVSGWGIDDYGSGWFRLWFTHDIGSGANAVTNNLVFYSPDDNWSYAGSGQSVYAYGSMVEENIVRTSYLPTSGTTSTRAKEEETPTYTLPNGIFDGTSAKGTALLWWNPQFDYNEMTASYYGSAIMGVRAGNAASLMRIHYNAGADDGRFASVDADNTAPYANVDWADNTWVKLAVKWGYLTSGQSKFQVGYDKTGGGITWGSELDFRTYNTTGTALEFIVGTATVPFMVRDFMLFDKVLTDGEINQLGY